MSCISKSILFHRGLQNPQIDGLACTEFDRVKFFQAIIEPTQARKLGVEREAAVIGDFAVGTREDPGQFPLADEPQDRF